MAPKFTDAYAAVRYDSFVKVWVFFYSFFFLLRSVANYFVCTFFVIVFMWLSYLESLNTEYFRWWFFFPNLIFSPNIRISSTYFNIDMQIHHNVFTINGLFFPSWYGSVRFIAFINRPNTLATASNVFAFMTTERKVTMAKTQTKPGYKRSLNEHAKIATEPCWAVTKLYATCVDIWNLDLICSMVFS